MQRSLLSFTIACLGLALGATTVLAQVPKDCRKFLITTGNRFECRAVTEGGEQFEMDLTFNPVLFSSKLAMRINAGTNSSCSCRAKKINLKKPEKVQFGAAKTFSCFVSGAEFSGPEFSGPENFLINQASYEGLATKKGIKKGEAIDRFGRTLVYECTRPVLP